jgi:hypothetical protein
VHDAAMQWIGEQYKPVFRKQLQLGLRLSVLDIGGRDVNGSPRHLFSEQVTDYTVLDIRPGDGVDIVADAATWDPDGQAWDVIICAETFEVLVEAGWADVVVDVQPSPADVRAVAVKES